MNVAEGDECRIAVLEDGKLYEYFVDRPSQLKHLGNIYKALVNNAEPAIQAAFVDMGMERNGFLHVSDINFAYAKADTIKELFPYPVAPAKLDEEGILELTREHEVEEVAEAVAGAPASDEEEDSDEADFLDQLEEERHGHQLTESPVAVLQDSDTESDSPVKDKARRGRRRPRKAAAATKTTQDPAEEAAPASGEAASEKPTEAEAKKTRRTTARRRTAKAEKPADKPEPENQDAPAAKKTRAPSRRRRVTRASDKVDTGNDKPVEPPEPKEPTAEAVEQAKTTAAEAAAEAENQRLKARRKRLPKKRGGKLPKRALAEPADSGAQPDGSGDPPTGGSGSSGGEGMPGIGPVLRYARAPMPKVQNLLKRGQEVVVQVTKAGQGGKGPGVSSVISLPGRYMVLTPNSSRGGVSRKIENQTERTKLRKMLQKLPVPQGMGVIIRTAAIDRSFDDLLRDLNYLLRMWNVIVHRIHESKAPALIYADSDPAIRTVRDYFTAETAEIVIDSREVYERVLAFFDALMPSFKDRVKLYDGDIPLFFKEGIEGQIDHIFDKKVPLKSGGYLFIEQTEALVSIDVNSGRFTSAGDAEKTAYLTNMEAIPEICRQLRLRDLGGIVCNDLIDMVSAKHRTDVENKLKDELRRDRARSKIAKMSPFGVIEMTRQRVRPSIRAYTYVTCPTCQGFAMVRSAETMCISLVRRMKLALVEERVTQLVVHVHPHVLSHLHSEFRTEIDRLEDRFSKKIVFEYAKDLEPAATRMFYISDRGNRVLYDIDQRINQFQADPAYRFHSAAEPPPATTTLGGNDAAVSSAPGSRRRRRGGRKQRERERERSERAARIASESQKAVTIADIGDLPPIPVETSAVSVGEGPDASNDGKRSRRRGRRGGRGRRVRRTGQVQEGTTEGPAATSAATAKPVAEAETDVKQAPKATSLSDTGGGSTPETAGKPAKKTADRKKSGARTPRKAATAKKTAASASTGAKTPSTAGNSGHERVTKTTASKRASTNKKATPAK
ncbi:MAG: Rne/Rng family ribonuclease, partial [Nitrospira sp.]|nr:Rne/Rng family ribonuclease [Nitrospira sp.]